MAVKPMNRRKVILSLLSACTNTIRPAAASHRNVHLRLVKLRFLGALVDIVGTEAVAQLTGLLMLDRMFLVNLRSHDGKKT